MTLNPPRPPARAAAPTWRAGALQPADADLRVRRLRSGLPLYLLINLLPAWLRSEGVDLKAIGLFALIQLPYTWKFLWSPLARPLRAAVARPAPRLDARRRSSLLLASIPAFGLLHPQTDLWAIAYLAAAVAFFSASQDIVLDAYRRELLPDAELGLGNSIYVNAYRISSLVPGALALILADHPAVVARCSPITALFMLPGLAMTLVVREPAAAAAAPRTLREAVVEPFREFIDRAGLAAGAAGARCSSSSTSSATAWRPRSPRRSTSTWASPRPRSASIAKNAGLWASVAGGMLGGLWMVKIGINRGLWLFGVVQVVSILGFAWLAQLGDRPDTSCCLAGVIAFEALGVGLGTAAFVAFIARATDPRYTATQFALFTSLAAVPRTVVNATTGWIVDADRLVQLLPALHGCSRCPGWHYSCVWPPGMERNGGGRRP